MLWHYDRQGEYSVKSDYILAMQSQDSECVVSSGEESCVWQAVWKLNVSPKMRIFLWPALLNILPTMDKSKLKRVVHVSSYHVCEYVQELVMHALVECDWAQEVWKLSKLLGVKCAPN